MMVNLPLAQSPMTRRASSLVLRNPVVVGRISKDFMACVVAQVSDHWFLDGKMRMGRDTEESAGQLSRYLTAFHHHLLQTETDFDLSQLWCDDLCNHLDLAGCI